MYWIESVDGFDTRTEHFEKPFDVSTMFAQLNTKS